MTPSLFTCAAGKQQSELDIAGGWGGPENARAVLERHWDTFITRADLERLAALGINTVRLPIGYWSLGPGFTAGTDFDGVGAVYVNSWPRVLRAINWAAEAGLGVLVDLHGAPSSQNGQSHSGVSTGEAGLWSNDSAVVQTLGVLSFLATQLAMVTNVVGIQILNEPKNVSGLADFCAYRLLPPVPGADCAPADDRAIAAMRVTSPYAQSLPLYVHDGFDLDRFSSYVANRSDFVVEDHHSYFVFTEADDTESASAHTVDIATGTKSMLAVAAARQRRNLIIGEWSCALTAKSLAGEVDLDAARTAFCAGQEAVYRNNTAGWAFWCTCSPCARARDATLTRAQRTSWNRPMPAGRSSRRSGIACPRRSSRLATARRQTPRRSPRSTTSWPRCDSSAAAGLQVWLRDIQLRPSQPTTTPMQLRGWAPAEPRA
jgi:glucan 1,3-beta-glucosidase